MTEADVSTEDSPRRRGRRFAVPESAADEDIGDMAAPLTIGATLRAARESAGLTLVDVAARTKVRPGILEEIEADDHERLPALTYTLGFVKAYARTVGIDPDEASRRYREESHKGEPVSTIEDLQPLDEQRRPSRRLIWMSSVLLALALIGFWAWGAGWLTPATPSRPEAARADSPATATILPEDAGGPLPDAGTSATGESTATATAGAVGGAVTITAGDEVWLRIADDRETFFTGILQPGQTLSLPPDRSWKLRTGRAGAVQVKVGDRALPPLGGAVEQLANLSLTPADLLARFAPPPGAAPAG